MNKKYFLALMTLLLAIQFPLFASGAEKKAKKDEFSIPSHVLDIAKENTYPNSTEDEEVIEPSDLTKELIGSTEVPITNPNLIKMLNETSIDPSPIAIGYRGMIFLGRWPLSYESNDTNINWEYQKINVNEVNNIGGKDSQKLNYNQQEQKEIKGALTNKIANDADVKQMMIMKAKQHTKLPLSFTTTIGHGTKKENSYSVPVQKYGYLHAYAPAVNEKGQVTFGEVYIGLKGTKKTLVIKNVTKQGIGAWIPIQDHVSFSLEIN
ncbi:YfkD famly protein [Ornithinibacillus contaminans]|uniref:YfkD famly protein n=1 Tax=Ornithinibacillus contaminans TaxID=694055 RepID=UPI00064DC030|nr:YfkD famly protein [Ornithinibacillus contaminans]